jgi:hypothetical protein
VLPGVVHTPLPSHVDRPVNVAVLQVGSLQLIPAAYFWHAPAAHLPLVPQLADPWSTQVLAGSAEPAGTLVQVPAVPGSAHDLHGFMHVVPQQTPCQHWLEAHSTGAEQLAPLIFLPQELPLQTLGVTQLFAVVQASKHFWPLHAKGAQGREFGAMHWPVAVQVDGGVYTLAAHFSPLHTLPTGYLLQPPAPSHFPSRPHEATPPSTHLPRLSALLAGRDVQRPSDEGRAQLRQAPAHTSAQQTPSTQKLEAHSVLAAHTWPFCLGPQLPFTQARPAAQSALLVHLLLQAPPTQRNGGQS